MTSGKNDSQGCSSWFKWLVGTVIALLAAGSGIVALLNYIKPKPPLPPPTSEPVICRIGGTIYDKGNSQPLSNVDVSYLRLTQDSSEYTHGIRSHLATTGPDGRFEADCAWVESENFPLRLVLAHPDWKIGQFQTDEYINSGETRMGITLYVPDGMLRNPPP